MAEPTQEEISTEIKDVSIGLLKVKRISKEDPVLSDEAFSLIFAIDKLTASIDRLRMFLR